MKTRLSHSARNMNQIVKAAFASAVILVASFGVSNAASVKNTSEKEIRTAIERLDVYNREIAQAVKFSAPAVEENLADLELMTVESNLDYMFSGEARNILYTSPRLNENANDMQAAEAIQSLDRLTTEVAQSILYTAAE